MAQTGAQAEGEGAGAGSSLVSMMVWSGAREPLPRCIPPQQRRTPADPADRQRARMRRAAAGADRANPGGPGPAYLFGAQFLPGVAYP